MNDRQQFYYVYILESMSSPGHFYTGFTEDLKQRLKDHNADHSPHTTKLGPWRLNTYWDAATAHRRLNSSVTLRPLRAERSLRSDFDWLNCWYRHRLRRRRGNP